MNNQSRTHQNWYGPIPRRSSLSDGWYGKATGGYKPGSAHIPASAWIGAVVFTVAFFGIVPLVGFLAGL